MWTADSSFKFKQTVQNFSTVCSTQLKICSTPGDMIWKAELYTHWMYSFRFAHHFLNSCTSHSFHSPLLQKVFLGSWLHFSLSFLSANMIDITRGYSTFDPRCANSLVPAPQTAACANLGTKFGVSVTNVTSLVLRLPMQEPGNEAKIMWYLRLGFGSQTSSLFLNWKSVPL